MPSNPALIIGGIALSALGFLAGTILVWVVEGQRDLQDDTCRTRCRQALECVRLNDAVGIKTQDERDCVSFCTD